MNKVIIAFGSNIGDRYKAIEEAMLHLEENGIKIVESSAIIETEPYGYVDQPPFINGAIIAETELSCREVLINLLKIEKDIGRVRLFKWGPRIIDLDIIFYNDEIYNEEDLVVPHKDMQNREFVLKPLYEICPDYVHPVLKKTIKELYEELLKSNINK
jgi:2-amino-4-hydroxy-6-hydroxymethyldihydropteridine diphosphokinase